MPGVQLGKPPAMKNPEDAFDPEPCGGQQFGQLRRIELPGVERVDRRVAAGGERDPVGRGHQQYTAGPQHSKALGDELPLVPKVFDHLKVDHYVDSRVGQRQ